MVWVIDDPPEGARGAEDREHPSKEILLDNILENSQ